MPGITVLGCAGFGAIPANVVVMTGPSGMGAIVAKALVLCLMAATNPPASMFGRGTAHPERRA